MDLDPLLKEKEAAEYLKVASVTLSKWRFYRKGPAYIKLSNRRAIRYKKEDLDEFIAQSRVNPHDK